MLLDRPTRLRVSFLLTTSKLSIRATDRIACTILRALKKQADQTNREMCTFSTPKRTQNSPITRSILHANPLPFAPPMSATKHLAKKQHRLKTPVPDAPNFQKQSHHYRATRCSFRAKSNALAKVIISRTGRNLRKRPSK